MVFVDPSILTPEQLKAAYTNNPQSEAKEQAPRAPIVLPAHAPKAPTILP
jgi:hypothetical protein